MPIRLPKHNTCDLALKKRKVMNHHHWELSAAEDTIWQDEWLWRGPICRQVFLGNPLSVSLPKPSACEIITHAREHV